MSIDRTPDASAEADMAAQLGSTQLLAEILDTNVRDDLTDETPARDFLTRFDIAFARTHGVMAFERGGRLFLAASNKEGWRQSDAVSRVLQRFAEPIVATEVAITTAINTAYSQQQSRTQDVIDSIDDDDGTLDVASLGRQEDLLDTMVEPP